jgi:hypothetical protein
MNIRITRVLLLLAAAVASVLPGLQARGDEGFSNPEDWHFIFTPYVWLLGQQGDITINGGTTEIDTDLVENAESFDIGAQFYAEARKGKWGIFTDSTYARSSTDSRDVDVQVEFVQSDFGLLYRLLNWPLGPHPSGGAPGRSLTLDAIFGGRYLSLDNETDIRIQPGFEIEVDAEKDWVDPIIGARLMADLTDRWLLIVRGDVGGFGVNSDFMWNLSTFVGYEAWEDRILLMGYRFLDVDYEEGNGADRFQYDVLSHGPLVGFVFRF